MYEPGVSPYDLTQGYVPRDGAHPSSSSTPASLMHFAPAPAVSSQPSMFDILVRLSVLESKQAERETQVRALFERAAVLEHDSGRLTSSLSEKLDAKDILHLGSSVSSTAVIGTTAERAAAPSQPIPSARTSIKVESPRLQINTAQGQEPVHSPYRDRDTDLSTRSPSSPDKSLPARKSVRFADCAFEELAETVRSDTRARTSSVVGSENNVGHANSNPEPRRETPFEDVADANGQREESSSRRSDQSSLHDPPTSAHHSGSTALVESRTLAHRITVRPSDKQESIQTFLRILHSLQLLDDGRSVDSRTLSYELDRISTGFSEQSGASSLREYVETLQRDPQVQIVIEKAQYGEERYKLIDYQPAKSAQSRMWPGNCVPNAEDERRAIGLILTNDIRKVSFSDRTAKVRPPHADFLVRILIEHGRTTTPAAPARFLPLREVEMHMQEEDKLVLRLYSPATLRDFARDANGVANVTVTTNIGHAQNVLWLSCVNRCARTIPLTRAYTTRSHNRTRLHVQPSPLTSLPTEVSTAAVKKSSVDAGEGSKQSHSPLVMNQTQLAEEASAQNTASPSNAGGTPVDGKAKETQSSLAVGPASTASEPPRSVIDVPQPPPFYPQPYHQPGNA